MHWHWQFLLPHSCRRQLPNKMQGTRRYTNVLTRLTVSFRVEKIKTYSVQTLTGPVWRLRASSHNANERLEPGLLQRTLSANGTNRTCQHVCALSAIGGRADIAKEAGDARDPKRTSLRRREYGMIRAHALRGRPI